MTEKKQETLADNLAKARKDEPNSAEALSQKIQQSKQEIDFNKLKTKLNDFQKKVVKKFPFTKAIGILPYNSYPIFEEDESIPKEETEKKPLHLIMIIPEEEYKNLNKIKTEVVKLAKETKENLWVNIKTVEVDLWSYGLDSKFEFLDAISMSFPLYDNGFLGALRVVNIHKNLVLNWLNVGRIRYVATYAIGGSLVNGTADETSDIDTFVIIDDTDVKRMSRIELIEKLRGRIVGEHVKEAISLAGVKNTLHVQVYLLTDFWQSVKDAQPVMFTFVRDAIPLYDRGTFIPWKRLLQMGRIKPSPEAIDLYMKEGDRTEEIVKRRLIDAMIDIYFGVVTPTQAMMMLSGHAPPVPKTIVNEVKKVLVDKEKVMTMKELKTLEKLVKLYKDYEHGRLNSIEGKEIDLLLKESKEYAKKMKELRDSLERKMQEYQANKIHDEIFSLMGVIFGNKKKEELIKDLENEMIKKGKIHRRMLKIANEIANIKTKVKGGKLKQSEMQRITKDASELMNSLTEYMQRKELIFSEKGAARISFNGEKAEILSTDSGIFFVQMNKISKVDLEKEKLVESNRNELEEALSKTKERISFNLPSRIIEILRKELGNFEINF